MSTAVMEAERAPAAEVQARWRPDARGWAVRMSIMLGLLLLLIWGTMSVPDFWADRFALATIYAIIGLSLNVVLGYTGQVSLGHHAFVGLAAFTSAYYVTEKAGCSPDVGCEFVSLGSFSIGIGLAVLSGIISAGLLGAVALRIKGLYLALITLTYGFVALNSIFEISFLTRGGAGMPAARPQQFASDQAYAFMCMGLLVLVLFVDWRFLSSKVGRAVLAVKESEAVAATYAVNVTAYKILAFMLSGAFAGLAGALFAHRRGIVVAVDFTFSIALLWVLMVVVGGLGKRVGVVIGSAFFALFPFLLTLIGPLDRFIHNTLNRDPEELTLIIGPLLALITIISFPGGIAEQLSPITRWLSGQRFTMHPEGKRHHGPSPLARLKEVISRRRQGDLEVPPTDSGEPADVPAPPPPPAEEDVSPSPVAAPDEADPQKDQPTEQVPAFSRDWRPDADDAEPAPEPEPTPEAEQEREPEPSPETPAPMDPVAETPTPEDGAQRRRLSGLIPRRRRSASNDEDWPDVLRSNERGDD